MNTDKFVQLLQQMKTDPRAAELVRGIPAPTNDEEAVACYADLAVKLGSDLSKEEITEGLRALSREQQARTEAARREMEKAAVGEDALDMIAGGATGKGREPYDDDGCWWQDACGRLINFY